MNDSEQKDESSNSEDKNMSMNDSQIERDNFQYKLSKSEKNFQLINFFQSYAMFINEASNVNLDMDVVLGKLNEATSTLKPPENSTQDIINLWNSLTEINKSSIDELAENLSKMPDSKLYETVQDLEKLNIKLMIEYNIEIKRGKQLGIIKNES